MHGASLVFQGKAVLSLLLASSLPPILHAANSELGGGVGERLVSVSWHVGASGPSTAGTQNPSQGR